MERCGTNLGERSRVGAVVSCPSRKEKGRFLSSLSQPYEPWGKCVEHLFNPHLLYQDSVTGVR
jgi:hypothetical protein